MPEQPEPLRPGILLSDDLMFTSRITGTARDLGLTIIAARGVETLVQMASQKDPACVIVDMSNPGLVIADLIGRLRETCSPLPRVIAYGSHVDAERLRAAREAGCDPVLPRSKFVEDLPRLLPEWLGPK